MSAGCSLAALGGSVLAGVGKNPSFADPAILVHLIEWADKLLNE